jgi:hypothetical protein
LQHAPGIGLQHLFQRRHQPQAELHRRVATGKPGQGDRMARFVEEAGIAGGRRFPRTGIVERHGGAGRDQIQQRRGRAAKQQGAGARIERLDMGATAGAQILAQRLLGGDGGGIDLVRRWG